MNISSFGQQPWPEEDSFLLYNYFLLIFHLEYVTFVFNLCETGEVSTRRDSQALFFLFFFFWQKGKGSMPTAKVRESKF